MKGVPAMVPNDRISVDGPHSRLNCASGLRQIGVPISSLDPTVAGRYVGCTLKVCELNVCETLFIVVLR
jgi:hypothetical protein